MDKLVIINQWINYFFVPYQKLKVGIDGIFNLLDSFKRLYQAYVSFDGIFNLLDSFKRLYQVSNFLF